MPELPDITIYQEALAQRIMGQILGNIRFLTPFVLKSVDPPPKDFIGREVQGIERIGKRIVICFPEEHFLVIHLMISGRLLWMKPLEGGLKPGGKIGLATLDFSDGRLLLTEASSHKRASIHLVRGRDSLTSHDPGGLEPLNMKLEDFQSVIQQENRTLKRALTNPKWFSGIGNAYSDEILHAARISPVRLTQSLSSEELQRLHSAIQSTLIHWIEKLRAEFGGKFPGKGQITAFRPDFAAHGKFGKPCPDCGMPIQRIQYAENETNYCARCQNEDRVLADRSLSRLLKDDWPRTIQEMVGE